jgi:SAM-dependent methyltransferase
MLVKFEKSAGVAPANKAEAYEHSAEPMTQQFIPALLAAIGLRARETFLDIAAGTGALSVRAAAAGALVTAIDASEDMIARVGERLADFSGCVALRMDGQNLELPDSSFDIVCSMFGVVNFPDPAAGISEMVRVARPGGRIGLTTWENPALVGPLKLFSEALRTEPAEPNKGGHDRRGVAGIHDADELRALCEAAGLTGVRISRETAYWHQESVDAVLLALSSDPMLALQRSRAHGMSIDMEEIADLAATRYLQSNGAIAVPTRAYMATGTYRPAKA